MPRIQVYDRQVGNVGPVQERRYTAEDFGGNTQGLENLGRGIAGLGSVIAEREGQAEVSDLSAKMAKAQADYTIKWNDTLRTANPGDRDLANRFLKEYQDHVEEIGSQINTAAGREFFNERRNKTVEHFTVSSHAGMAELAGVKAVQDHVTRMNAYSSAVLSDPGSYEPIRASALADIEASVKTKGLSREAALQFETKARSQLATDAIEGWTKLDPEGTIKQLKEGRWDTEIDGDTKRQMLGMADQEIRAREAEAARQRAEAKRLREEAQAQTQNDFLEKMVKGSLNTRAVLSSNLDAFGSGSKETFIQMLKANAEKPVRTDPRVFSSLYERIHAPEGDPKKIVDENELNQYVIGRTVAYEDLIKLRGEISGKKTLEGQVDATLKTGFLSSVKGSITNSVPMLGKIDNIGDQKYYEAQAFVEQQIAARKKEGKSIAPLFDPKAPEFLGRQMGQFQRSAQDLMRDMSQNIQNQAATVPAPSVEPTPQPSALATPPPAKFPEIKRRPEESASDFLKRKKAKVAGN